jgi:hypothetical protein
MAKTKGGIAPVEPKKVEDGSEEDYEAKHALEDILRADGHKENKELMKRVHKHAGRKMKALKGLHSIQDLKDEYERKYGKD